MADSDHEGVRDISTYVTLQISDYGVIYDSIQDFATISSLECHLEEKFMKSEFVISEYNNQSLN